MAKILTCPNCGNNKNLATNSNSNICGECGYSWVSVSNSNIKSSEIKVVMDSLNHYKYTLNQYNNNENTFPFYAINNDFIEAKGSSRNRLIKINPLDRKTQKQNYVGVDRLKKSFRQRPIVRYSDSVRSAFDRTPEKVVSDRSNQEYEISRATPERTISERAISEPSQPRQRVQKDRLKDEQSRENKARPELSPRNPSVNHGDFTPRNPTPPRENILRENPPREKIELEKKPSLSERINELNALNEYAEKDPDRFFREFEITKVNEDGSVEVQPKEALADQVTNQEAVTEQEGIPFNQQAFNQQPLDDRQPLDRQPNDVPSIDRQSIPRQKRERLSEEQKEYKNQLRQRLETSHREKTLREKKLREETLQKSSEQTIAEAPLTYEQYQEKRIQKASLLKEAQKTRRERTKTKEHTPRDRDNKYSRGERKYTKKGEKSQGVGQINIGQMNVGQSNLEATKEPIVQNELAKNGITQNRPTKDYKEKYLDKENFSGDNFNREARSSHSLSKKLRSEITKNAEKTPSTAQAKSYDKKVRDFKYALENRPSNAYNASTLDDMINASVDDSLINVEAPRNLFGRNSRLSFFENLKVNNDGTIKEDPLGLNQNYNEFFNKNDLALGAKKYNFSEIIAEIKKRINKDKMSFNLVVLIIIFGFFGMLSHFITKSNADKNTNKMVTELDIGKDFAEQIPLVDDNPKLKGANGTSDALVISKAQQDTENDTLVNATSNEEMQEILMQGKKNIASDLSLEELRANKLADVDKTKTTPAKNTSSFVAKTMTFLQQKATQVFSDVNVVVNSTAWRVDSNGKYFEINLSVNNKSATKSYVIRTLEITLLDVSGNVIGKREIYPNKNLRVKENANSSIRIPNAPALSANAYVKVLEFYAK